MRESVIEKKVCDYARSRGWLVYKFTCPGKRGVPDRLFIRWGEVRFAEFKAPGKKPTKLQAVRIAEIEDHEILVHVIDGVEDGKRRFK